MDKGESPPFSKPMNSFNFNDDIRALLESPVYELNTETLCKLRLFLLQANIVIGSELTKREEIIDRATERAALAKLNEGTY